MVNITNEEIELENYWIDNILPNWDTEIKNNTNFIWRKGVPFRLRAFVWRKAIENGLKMTPNILDIYYEKSKKIIAELIESNLDVKINLNTKNRENLAIYAGLIERDIPRTLPELEIFKELKNEPGVQVKKVLESYACYNPDIGYVQGMSYLACTFLLYMNPYETFICLANIMNSHFFAHLCKIDRNQIARHFQIFQIIFGQEAQALSELFFNFRIQPEQFLLDWYITLFTKIDFTLSHRIWDCIFFEGEGFIHRVAVAILKLYETELLQTKSFEECLTFLHSIPKTDPDQLIQKIQEQNVPTYVYNLIQQMAEEDFD